MTRGGELQKPGDSPVVRNEEGAEDREIPDSSISKEKTTAAAFSKERSWKKRVDQPNSVVNGGEGASKM